MIEAPGILDRVSPRRRLLQLGASGAIATLLNQGRLRASQSAEQTRNPIRSCILLMLYGGPSHLDTWDMKPDAPREIRGEYRAIRTKIPGRFVCEHLPGCARIIDELAVIRSMHHNALNHNAAVYQTLAGRRSTRDDALLPANRFSDFPNFGAIVSRMDATGDLPLWPGGAAPLVNVALPHVLHNVVDLAGQNAGFLGASHDPLQIVGDPSRPDFRVRNLSLTQELSQERIEARRGLLRALDANRGAADEAAGFSAYRERAFDLLKSEPVQQSFRLELESAQTRDRYGRHKLGQSLLLARRLVESGVRFINVHDGVRNGQRTNWDSHETLFPRHRELLAPFDQGFSALIGDLRERGLLDSTLVVAMGEFGRSPRINAKGGRDHWPNCYSVALAGGGAEGGATFGSSDRIGAIPDSQPVTPGDLAATLFWRFGLDPRAEIRDRQGRPFPLADGAPIRELFPGA